MMRMRSAVGVCAVSATLVLGPSGLLGVTAVASADTGSDSGGSSSSQTGSGSSESSSGSTATTPGSSSGSTTKTPRPGAVFGGIVQDRIRTTIRDFTGALGGIGATRQPPKVTIFPQPKSQQAAGGTTGSTVTTAAPSAPDAQGTSAPDPTAGTAPAGTAPTASTDPSATAPATTAPATTAPATTAPSTSAPKPASPFSFKPPPLPQLATSVSGSVNSAVNSAKDAIDALPALLAALPTSTDPVGAVLTTVQSVLTSVGESVITITEIPGDITTLLGFPATAAPATTIGSSAEPVRVSPPAATPMDLLPVLLAPAAVPVTVDAAPVPATAPPAFAGTTSAGLSQELARTDPLALHGVSATGSTASVLERAVSKMLVPVSIAALAALALPGVGGLLVVCAMGVRIGYRQAKANFVMQASGIARFAGPGPLGVVRSGSLISLSKRAVHGGPAHTRRPAAAPSLAAVVALDQAA